MVEILVTSSVLILALMLLRLLGNRVSARVRYALWGLVLLRLLLPAGLFTSSVSVMNAAPILENYLAVAPVVVDPVVPDEPVVSDVSMVPDEGVGQAPSPALADPLPPLSKGGQPSQAAGGIPSPLNLRDLLKGIWLVGACALGGYFLLSNVLFYRKLRREAVPRPEAESPLPVYEADFLPSPCMAGLFRPAIYLNAAALENGEGLRHVLAHEYCHKRHGDNWWALLRCLCLAAWWFHPLVWVAAWLSRRDCELSCDESALKLLGEEERVPYGRTLVGLTARPAPGDLLRCTTAMTAGKRALKERVIHLASMSKMSRSAVCTVLVLALAVGLCTFTGAKAAQPGSVGVDNYYIKVPAGYYVSNPEKERNRGGFVVEKEEWETALKELDPALIAVSYPTASETKDVMMNIGASWAMAFGQQFYHLDAAHPGRAADVLTSYVGSFSSTYQTASGGSQIINSTTVSISFDITPVGDIGRAAERLGGWINTQTVNGVEREYIYVNYNATLTRKTGANGTTIWSCTELTTVKDLTEEDRLPTGSYSPTALPVTVAPKEGWQLDQLDSQILAVPDLGWNTHSPEDNRELEIRAAMAFGQEYYALKPGHPYRASEVRILPGEGRNLIIAVKPVGGVEAVEPYFNGACPKGVGDLEGFVLLSYSISPQKQVVAAFGDKSVYTFWVSPYITIGPAQFNVAELPGMTADDREIYDQKSAPRSVEAQGTGQAGRENAVADFAAAYANLMYEPYNNHSPDASYYEVKLLDAKLTGWSEGNGEQVVSGTMTYAFLPTWGAEAAMAFHPGQCTLGTGALEGYVVRTVPVFYLRLTEKGLWSCAGLCTGGDGKSADSVWLSETFLRVDPLTAPPAGVTWVTAN